MVTAEALQEMNLGDIFKCGTLFHGVTDEKVVWELIEKTATEAVFILTYFGVIFQTKTLTFASLPKEGK